MGNIQHIKIIYLSITPVEIRKNSLSMKLTHQYEFFSATFPLSYSTKQLFLYYLNVRNRFLIAAQLAQDILDTRRKTLHAFTNTATP